MRRSFIIAALALLLHFNITEAHAVFSFAPVVDVPTGSGIVDGATFGMIGKAGHSYLCGIRGDTGELSISGALQDPGSQSINGVRPATSQALRYNQRILGTEMTDSNASNNYLYFIAPTGAAASGKYQLTINISGAAPSYVYATCVDTTVICQFNTYVNDANFLEVTNLGQQPGRVKLLINSANGSSSAAPNTITFPAGLRRDVDIHSLVGPQNYGSIFLQFIDSDTIEFRVTPRVSNYQNGTLRESIRCESSSFFGQG